MKAIIITIGDELLIGQVLNSNSQWLGEQCTLNNISVEEILTIHDGIDVLNEKLESLKDKTDLIILSGGLGPTRDDYTVEALSKFYQDTLTFDQPTWQRIEDYFTKRKRTPSENLKKQAIVPAGMTLLLNDLGTAPGLYRFENGLHLIALPGVPYEMKHLFSDRFLPILSQYQDGTVLEHLTILTAGIGESDLAQKIAHIEENLPSNISLAYLPDIGRVRLRYSIKHSDVQEANAILEKIGSETEAILGDIVYGRGKTQMADVLQSLFVSHQMTLGFAESCTGGLLASTIVQRPGVSAFFKGSVVSYSPLIKESVLNVPQSIINQFGVVSTEVAESMADGALKTLDVDVAASVTGLAGPDGGSDKVPVGTFCIGIARKGYPTKSFQINFHRDRERNLQFITFWILNQLRKELLTY